MTFQEAMALDPAEVEFNQGGSSALWHNLGSYLVLSLEEFRLFTFRRARAKRPRVEEMAETFLMEERAGNLEHTTKSMTHAIRAVCEYLREREDIGELRRGWAAAIERHFLEPR